MYYGGMAQRRAFTRRALRPLERKMDRPGIRDAVQRGLHQDTDGTNYLEAVSQVHDTCILQTSSYE